MVTLHACPKRDIDTGPIVMEEFKDLDRLFVAELPHLKLQRGESSDEPARNAKTGSGVTVHHEIGGNRVSGVQVRSGGYDIDGTPGRFERLPIEFKAVEVIPQVSQTSSASRRACVWLGEKTTCEIARSLWVFPLTVACQEKPNMTPIAMA